MMGFDPRPREGGDWPHPPYRSAERRFDPRPREGGATADQCQSQFFLNFGWTITSRARWID